MTNRLFMPGMPWGMSDLGRGYRLGYTVGESGDAWPVLWSTRAQGEPQFVPYRDNQFRDVAPHEIPNEPLPPEMQARIDAIGSPRCGAATAAGRPCRNRVRQAGAHCRMHRHAAAELHPVDREDVTLW